MLWNFQYRDSSGHPRRRRLKLNLCFNWRVCSPFTSYTLLHWNTSTLIWWNLYKWVLFSPCLSTLTPSDRDQFLSPLRPLICAISIRCCFHLLTKSNFTSAHSLTDQIKGAQEWVYLMGGTHAQTTSLILQQRILPVITASLSPTAAGRSLMGRNSGACDNYFHQCITSHLYRFGFKEYVICVSLSHSRPYIAK